MRTTPWIGLLLLAVTLPPTATAQHFPPADSLRAMIRQHVEDDRGMAIVLGVMEADGSTTIVSYGDAGDGARQVR